MELLRLNTLSVALRVMCELLIQRQGAVSEVGKNLAVEKFLLWVWRYGPVVKALVVLVENLRLVPNIRMAAPNHLYL